MVSLKLGGVGVELLIVSFKKIYLSIETQTLGFL